LGLTREAEEFEILKAIEWTQVLDQNISRYQEAKRYSG
jgi:hypothetical protein